ncbi:eukaryotic translation initiation factor 4 gamma 3 isoform X2 [Pimephales promelas]|uniref:eukaryotic translation initiation factor 4 gamma 3 isoform X2 n=1 Tax=Pimephales promelas TaxID=90988 RepID=UPI001955ACC1|nr:eukaryotic translation initiation factor 4 gamma 3 isoform X2 [Pimephales promelas]KAG1949716.1 eukaryotic translation initiation factor 4 gamma [Pimephales promelas]
MSLPQKVVQKPAAVSVSGHVTGPAPPTQLRATLTSVSLPPGVQSAPPPSAVPPTQIPRGLSLDERMFSHPGVTAVYSVSRHPGSPYPGHDLSKTHPNLAGTPPGHAPSQALSQVSVPAGPSYRFFKAWETSGAPSYNPAQNAGSTPLVYSPQTQPMNVQPQTRPFMTGPRQTHHQFLHRAQMQTARPSLPANSPSLRPGSQTPTATVYTPNQPFMMTMTPMPFPTQTHQYYIPQYRHSAPYMGHPQQITIQPPGSGTFYPGPGPGEYPPPYATGPPYYAGQPVYPPSPPIIVPAQLPPPPAKREKKPIRIRDPNQGGKDITEEIMFGSRNPTPPAGHPVSTLTPPAGRPSSTPTPPTGHLSFTPSPPQQPSNCQTPEQVTYVNPPQRLSESPAYMDGKPSLDDRPKMESGPIKSVSPGPKPSESSLEKREAPSLPLLAPSSPEVASDVSSHPSSGCIKPTAAGEPEFISSTTTKVICGEESLSVTPPRLSASPSPSLKVVNGLAESQTPLSSYEEPEVQEGLKISLSSEFQLPTQGTSSTEKSGQEVPVTLEELQTPKHLPSLAAHVPITPIVQVSSSTSSTTFVLAPPPGLAPLVQPVVLEAPEQNKPSDDVQPKAQDASESQTQNNSKKFIPSAQAVSAVPKSWKKPNEEILLVETLPKENEEEASKESSAEDEMVSQLTLGTYSSPFTVPEHQEKLSEENGETETEPFRNGVETESTDSGVTLGDSRGSMCSPTPPMQEGLAQSNGKRQYDRDFLLGFQFMPACVQKPEGLPQISDVVLDKINQNKLPLRSVDPRLISRGAPQDFTPAFADFSRQMPGGRGALLMHVRRPPPRKIIVNVSVIDDVQLKKSENAWKPGMKRESVPEDPDALKTQDLFRKVRSILNKLTPQMFNQLMKQVTDLTINTEERLKGVIDLVFEKAIDEPSFSVAYANMCRCLATLKVPTADKPNTTVNFRKLLLNRCQKEFERDKVDDVVLERKQKELDSATSPSERERMQEELEEAKDKARRRSTGNIKFIGELFKLKMLTEPIMHDCVVKLLKNHDDESLECLCRLLTTIGKDLDFEKAKPRMDQYFNQMEKIVKERKTSSRIRFMVQDVIDLRLHNWVSRRADQGPKTIEQIHKEAKLEEQEEQRKVHQQLLSKDIKRRPDQREQRSQREETWNTVPTTKNSRTIDPAKIPKISKPQIDEKIQLGPRAQINWIKGSSGGAKASDSELTRSASSTLNRYSALQSSTAQSNPPPAQTSESDSRRSLGSRGSTGRERGDKPVSLGPSRPGPFSRGSSTKELTDNLAPEDTRAEGPDLHHTLRKASISEEKCEIENNRATEKVKSEILQVTGVSEKPVLSEEEVERKSKSIIDEFLHINDYKEAVQCVVEMEQPSLLYVFVRMGLECTLERSQKAREHMGLLYYQLIQKGILPHSELYKGFSEMLEQADDMAIDVPFIWLYLAEMLSPLLREGGMSMRELFSELSKPLLPVGRAAILFSEILHLLCKQMSHRKVGDLWRESGLNWADFLPEGELLPAFISQQKLEFTVSDVSPVSPDTAKPSLSPEELFKQLEQLLLEDMASDEQIFDWIEANLDESQMSSSPFLRALMTAVCKAAVKDESTSCRVDTAIIQRRLPILHKYLNSDTERQLQALYALQSLIVTLDQPPNLLRMFFDCLYDEDVISEDAFYQWETSKDPAEQQGKGVALKSVTAFFTWLREAEEESEDN